MNQFVAEVRACLNVSVKLTVAAGSKEEANRIALRRFLHKHSSLFKAGGIEVLEIRHAVAVQASPTSGKRADLRAA